MTDSEKTRTITDEASTWEIKRETVYRLYRDGEPIRNTDGEIVTYESEEHAQHVAANWELYRCPTQKELRALSDEELQAAIDSFSRPRWRFW